MSQYTPYTKDAFHRYVINDEKEAVSPDERGTKVAAHHVLEVQGGEERVLRCRLTIAKEASEQPFGEDFEKIFESRKNDADQFYDSVIPGMKNIAVIFVTYSLIFINNITSHPMCYINCLK